MFAQMFYLLEFLFFFMIFGVQTEVQISQTPLFYQVKNGESVSITCEIKFKPLTLVGTYLKRNLSNATDVIYIHKTKRTVHQLYTERYNLTGDESKFTIILKKLQKNDTDIYYCQFGIRGGKETNYWGQGTLILVSEPKMKPCAEGCVGEDTCKEISYQDPIVIGVIVAAVVALLCVLILLLCRVKKLCRRDQPQRGRAPNSVYEDMNLVRTQSMAR